ncbi:CRISPR/Cas system-associated RNA-guided endonuclease Cas9 [Campylobacter blaseri]|uniref:CRISPR-associated endonuclease Cas9 n=1 Tax=Campylobacter blaseri TaxID=2042961 RepID=A0A2P8R3D8_9BACT|nr:type II CRISPR RNA-guided endonuclease Cas9 [Campylobacter blaseri]PSM53009.1 type II CRISPR RNA-guided endonuclease Cas9 [Campylobacter blaseri]PSM54476.1 type II CRISPR RNA-guided endonuclease Cas9 [Campylobacter blaseri]QKF85279.1 CRISPR/Cas system-associated RNA-guided endonuclease Cas9 [Campylobacter blaseri]
MLDKKSYYLGLDIGTNSIGWAVSDEFYNILKIKGQKTWGVRLFDDAMPAAERRGFRSSRRRGDRVKWRLGLLRNLFSSEIDEVDNKFFKRLEDSKFFADDKGENQTNTLFNDIKFKDRDFHKKYNSIYHLRYDLITKDEKFDLRLVYLAIHHIVKKRGHFLFDGEIGDNKNNFSELTQNLIDELLALDINVDFLDNFQEVLKDESLRLGDKKAKLKEIITVSSEKFDEKKVLTQIVNLLCGKGNLKIFFPESEEKKIEISLLSDSFDENFDNLLAKFGEDANFIKPLKDIFDYILLQKIMKDSSTISESKIKSYKKHKKDLKKLKDLILNEYGKDKFNEVFKSSTKDNYPAYVGHFKTKKLKDEHKKTTKDDFYAYIKKIINKSDSQIVKTIKDDIELGNFLPRLIDGNSVIPHQIHKSELIKIIDNQTKFYPFLKDIKDKIISIFEFRIPFYVGPLNDYHKDKGGNAWIVKNSNEKIYPWNFDKVVNIKQSAQNFITKMTNKCSYLLGEDVLPKNSLLFSKYCVLNELNNLKVNDEDISVELKKELYENLFKKQKSVSKSSIKKHLINNGYYDKNLIIEGVDDKLTSNLKSYIELKEIVGNSLSDEEKEEIIKYIALFGYDKKMLKSYILDISPSLDEKTLDRLCTLKYSGFGSLSKKLLVGIKSNDKTLIQILEDTNKNLMQLVSDEFKNEIEKHNNEYKKQNNLLDVGLSYGLLDNLYVGPSVKRGIWQSLRLIDEIISAFKYPPKKIFIEMAREEGRKERTKSRKDQLLELYKSIKKDGVKEFGIEFDKVKTNLEKEEQSRLNSKKLYLYYMQFGKDIYAGNNIDISKLFDENIYDIDHIIPRSIKKDDSFDNLVLTNKISNKDKTDVFPVSFEVQNKMRSFWKMLKDKGLMSSKKLHSLTRTTPLSEDEKAEFIARQLVETRQSTKAVATLLKDLYKNSEIVYVKAGIVSEFRQKFDLIKCRDLNDLHHAKDAYLNIAVGNAYNVKFTKNPRNFFKKYKGEHYNLKIEKLLERDIIRGQEFGWDAKKSIKIVKDTMINKNPYLVTYMSYEANGGLFNQQPVKAKEGLIPLKADPRLKNTSRYGGYNGKSMAYFFIFEYKKGKNRQLRIDTIPIYLKKDIENGKLTLKEYCQNNLGFEDVVIKLPKLLKNSLIKVDGYLMKMTGNNEDKILCRNAVQLILNSKEELLLKKVLKIVDKINEAKRFKKEYFINKYQFDIEDKELLELYDRLTKKHETAYKNKPASQIETLKDGREKFISLSLEDKCLLLSELLKLFDTTAQNANLSLIGGSPNAGSVKFVKNLSDNKTYKIIFESISGFYKKEIDLNKL